MHMNWRQGRRVGGRTGLEIQRHLMGLALVLCASVALGGDLYWDCSTSAGYQHGDGNWSDTKWTANGTVLSVWSDGNTAKFSASAAGSSTIMLDGMGVTCSGLEAPGANYTLIVTNGGTITSTAGNFIWGYGNFSNRLVVSGGAGVTSRVSHAGSFWVGYAGNTHELIIDGQGVNGTAVVTNNGGFDIGYTHASSKSSHVTVRRGGHLIIAGGNLIVGRSGDYQEMIVEDGGLLTAGVLYLGNSGGHSNTLRVTGVNTVVDQVPILYVATDTNLKGNQLIIANGAVVTNAAFRVGNTGCSGNTLSVTNGGRLYTTSNPVNLGYLGATSNAGLVSGSGSSWNLKGNSLEIGDVGQPARSNVLMVADGGVVTNVNLLTVVSNNTLKLWCGTVSARQATLHPAAQTIVGISAATTPGAGWGFLSVTNGTLALNGGLAVILRASFVPSYSQRFNIMTNTGAGTISGVFSNASNGTEIDIYAEGTAKPIGCFTVEIGTRHVTLTRFRPSNKGTVFMIQ